jgi:tetratricopeptide (TPR) repeat protein
LLLLGLTLDARRDDLYHRASEQFALVKPAENVEPGDFGFAVATPGEAVGPQRRPFYDAYVARRASVEALDGSDARPYEEDELAQELRSERGFVLLGQPLDGKSRTLYEVLSRLNGYQIVKPSLSEGMPGEDAVLLLVGGKDVILLLEDLHEYVGAQIDLPELYGALGKYASSCVVAATCRDGPELRLVEEKLGRLYEEMPLKLKLIPPTVDEKGRLARSIGEDWDPEAADDYPTLGSVAMERPMEAMALRFRNLLWQRPDHVDALRALKLLTTASIRPLTHERVEAVWKKVFGRTGLHLRDCLRALADQSFLREDSSAEGSVRPEPAYLRDAVTYTDGKEPEDDFFPALVDTLEEVGDAEALTNLGVVCVLGMGQRWSAQAAYDCFDRATRVDPNYASAWLNKTGMLSHAGHREEAVRAAERAVELKPNAWYYWESKGRALYNAGRYEAALDAYHHTNHLELGRSRIWRNLGATYMARSRYRDALSAYNRSIDLGADYEYAKGWMGRAQALQRLGRARDALRAYDRVTDTKPDYFEAWFNKSGVLRTLARHESALIATARAESIRPDHVDVHLAQGESLVALAKRDDDAAQWEQAYEAYVRATNLDENHASAWSMKGVALLMLGRFAEGSEALERAILLRPEYVQDWWHKAQALLKMAEGQPMESSVEVRAGLWWLCRAWRARDRLPDRGASVLHTFQQVGYHPNRCDQDFPYLQGLPASWRGFYAVG